MSSKGAFGLWEQFKKTGNFSDSYYDKCIIDDLKKALSISGNFENSLKIISEEQFLKCFFDAISPLISMYTDILNFFERCGANSSNRNIEITIESDISGFVNFNASHFIHTNKVIKKIKQIMQKVKLTNDGVREFWRLPCEWECTTPPIISSKSFNKWYELYRNQSVMNPSVELDFLHIIGTSPIKTKLSNAYTFWKELCRHFDSLNINYRDDLRNYLLKKRKNDGGTKILLDETDYIIGTALGGLYYVAEFYDSFPTDLQNEVNNTLDKINSYVHDVSVTVISEHLEQFLRLPTWKQRHELYSVWVFTRLIANIPDKYISYNIKDNKLSFTFSRELILSKVVGLSRHFFQIS